VSVAQFVDDHFGPEVLEYVAEPLLAGVYGGDSASLSAESVLPRFVAYERQYGSLIRAVQQERRSSGRTGPIFQSFRDGMQTLTDSLARVASSSTDVIFGEAIALEREGAAWRIRFRDHD